MFVLDAAIFRLTNIRAMPKNASTSTDAVLAMDEALRNIVAPYMIAFLPLGYALSFVATARSTTTDHCRSLVRAAKDKIRAGVRAALQHGVSLPFFNNDGAVCPVLAFDLWDLDDPLETFAALWQIDTSEPGDIDAFFAQRIDPFDQVEVWEVYNAGEPCWESVVYLRNQVVDMGWWPSVEASPLVPPLNRIYPSLPTSNGILGHYVIAYLRDGRLGAGLCFWQADPEDSDEIEDAAHASVSSASSSGLATPNRHPIDDASTQEESQPERENS